jgi:LacI family transcriptional regulator
MERKTLRVGVFTDYIGRYGRDILQGVARYVNAHADWELATLPFYSLVRPPEISDIRADGAIAYYFNETLIEQFARYQIPAVNVSAESPYEGIISVISDDLAVGRMAAKFFMDAGFRNFVYTGWLQASYAKVRGEGFMTELALHGFECRSLHVSKPEFKKVLPTLRRPLAMFVSTDSACLEALDACQELGLSVPEQVAILGVDNDELVNSIARPRLASIEIPAKQIGYEAAAILSRIMDGETVPMGTTLLPPTRIVVRGSADIIAVEDPEVASALQFIREAGHTPIRVQDVLSHVLLSRRTLERRFIDALGRTPLEEIHRVRIERAKRLLTDTNVSVPEVARKSGFTDETRFGSIFKRNTGETPTGFRRRTHFA